MSALAIWTIYDHPTDYPDNYVARRFEIDEDGAKPTASIIIAPDLQMLRDMLCYEMHLTPICRDLNDDSKIVESWL